MLLFEGVAKPRLELIATIVLDSSVMIVALAARWALLRAYNWFVGDVGANWELRALEFVFDFGIVGAAAAFVLFDLAKRVRASLRAFNTGERLA